MTSRHEEKARTLFSEGIRLVESGNLEFALSRFEEALHLAPNRPSILNNLAALLIRLERNLDAIPYLELASKLDTETPVALNNLALAYSSQFEKVGEAKDLASKCTVMFPGYAPAWNTLAIVNERLGDWRGAENAYHRALNLNPAFAEAQHNLAVLELMGEKFDLGWPRYEWRWRNKQNRSSKLVESSDEGWNGRDHLVFWAEHGIGDQLLYMSMLEALDQEVLHGGRVATVFCEDKLVSLLRAKQKNVSIQPISGLANFMSSSDAVFGVSLGSIRHFLNVYADIPYDMQIRPRRFAGHSPERRIIASGEHELRVGISWRSTSKSRGSGKSTQIDDFCSLASRVSGLRLVNLQFDCTDEERARVRQLTGEDLIDARDLDKFDDLLGLSNLIQSCDFVVCVSNSVAHIAGAVGAPTVVLVTGGMNRLWYWHLEAGPSRWYENLFTVEVLEENWGDAVRQALHFGMKKIGKDR